MIVDNFDIKGVAILETKTYAPLIVHANIPLSRSSGGSRHDFPVVKKRSVSLEANERITTLL